MTVLERLKLYGDVGFNLSNIGMSAMRTLGQANCFLRKEKLYFKDLEERINNNQISTSYEFYDEIHSMGSDLVKCCEMYLKAIYIYESNVKGNTIENIWNTLKNPDYVTDVYGNLIYMNSKGLKTYLKYDENGNPIVDENNKLIYYDDNGDTYNENSRGSKIKRSGHQLDKLIDLLSDESKEYLILRMMYIPMKETDKNKYIDIVDVMAKIGFLDLNEVLTNKKLFSLIYAHRKTFEEARYSGQIYTYVDVEFLYHLATQLRALAHFRFKIKDEDFYDVSNNEFSEDSSKEYAKNETSNSDLDFTKTYFMDIVYNKEIEDKTNTLLYLDIKRPKYINFITFYKMLKYMSVEEIIFINYVSEYLNKFVKYIEIDDESDKMVNIYKILKELEIPFENLPEILCEIKINTGGSFIVDYDNFCSNFRKVYFDIKKAKNSSNSSSVLDKVGSISDNYIDTNEDESSMKDFDNNKWNYDYIFDSSVILDKPSRSPLDMEHHILKGEFDISDSVIPELNQFTHKNGFLTIHSKDDYIPSYHSLMDEDKFIKNR